MAGGAPSMAVTYVSGSIRGFVSNESTVQFSLSEDDDADTPIDGVPATTG